MKIALIHPALNQYFEIFSKKLARFYFNEGNVMPPLGLGYISAVLEQEGHNVLIIDMSAENLSDIEALKILADYQPDLIGFSVLTHIFPQAVNTINLFKEKMPSVKIIVGGHHIELYSNYILRIKNIDFAIEGEGEETIREFIIAFDKIITKQISNPDTLYSEIKGLHYRDKEGKQKINPPREVIKNLDAIKFPARHLFKQELYHTFFSDKSCPTTSVITSRGCPFQCTFCGERYSNYRLRSVKNVLDELEEIYTKYNIRDINFNDGTFTIDKKRTLQICQGIIDRNLKIRFNIRTRVDVVDEDILKNLALAGCNRINYGLESGNQMILNNIKKNTSLEKIKYSVELTKKFGIEVWAFFILGCPGETKETLEQTIKLAIALEPNYVQFSRLNPFPGTELYLDYVKKTNDDIWLSYSMGESENKDISLPNSNFTIDELNKYVLKAYKRFYYRPKYIFRKIKEIHSFSSLLRYIKAALAIL